MGDTAQEKSWLESLGDELRPYGQKILDAASSLNQKIDFNKDGQPDLTQLYQKSDESVRSAIGTLKEKGNAFLAEHPDVKETADDVEKFLGNNKGGLMGALAAVVLGIFTGMDILPMLLLGLVGFVAGGALGDGENGLLGGLFGSNSPNNAGANTPQPQQSPGQAQSILKGQDASLTVNDKIVTLTMGGNGTPAAADADKHSVSGNLLVGEISGSDIVFDRYVPILDNNKVVSRGGLPVFQALPEKIVVKNVVGENNKIDTSAMQEQLGLKTVTNKSASAAKDNQQGAAAPGQAPDRSTGQSQNQQGSIIHADEKAFRESLLNAPSGFITARIENLASKSVEHGKYVYVIEGYKDKESFRLEKLTYEFEDGTKKVADVKAGTISEIGADGKVIRTDHPSAFPLKTNLSFKEEWPVEFAASTQNQSQDKDVDKLAALAKASGVKPIAGSNPREANHDLKSPLGSDSPGAQHGVA